MRGRRTSPPIHPRKAPRQERSRELVEWILAAATRILAADGLAGLTTNRVAEVAGISVGSLYQYFPNKEAIVVALIERTQRGVAEAVEAVATQMRAAPLPEAIAVFVDLALHAQYDRSTLAVALDHEEQRLALHTELAAVHQRIRQAVADTIRPSLGGLSPEAVDEAADDLFLLVRSMVDRAGATGIPRERIRPRVHRAALGYLEACRAEGRLRPDGSG
jgi:AcrR family transcriptional regulator